MLNFSRFKYRRKGCLEFYSPTRNKSENQLVPDSRQDQGRKERLEVQNGRNDFTSSSDATCLPRNNATTQPSPYEKELQSQNKSESCINSHSKCVSPETKAKSFERHDEKALGWVKSNPRSTSNTVSRDFISGEDRLSSILCNGFLGDKNCVGNEDEENVQVISRKRKERMEDLQCKSGNRLECENNILNSCHKNIKNDKKLDSYEIFKPRSKRKKVILLDDSSDDDDDVDKCNIPVASGTKEAENIEKSLGSDVEKLREIYPNLTIAQAKEAIRNRGSLIDAILDLTDALNTEDVTESSTSQIKAVSKKQISRKPMKVIIDNSDEDSVLGSPKKYFKVTNSSGNSGCEESSNDDETDKDDSDDYEEMTEEQSMIWSFFQEASVTDIGTVPGCSEKKAIEIIKHRPFRNFHDLFFKVSKIKGVSTRIVEDSINFINEQTEVDKLLVRCQKISKNISKAIRVQSRKNEGDDGVSEVDFLGSGFLVQQPSILNSSFELKHYQLSGLNWLITLHNEGVNGILADQMGLGKTIQALAFLGYLIENGNVGPHVIIVPSSTCDNWLREIETWLPTVSYIQYKGSQEERFALREEILYGEEEYHIIISTYNIAISTAKDRSLFRRLKSHYLILDEGHMIKNMKSNRYKHLMDIKSTRRLLLTGTPLQNNLIEMISLLSFLMPDFFAERINGISLLFGSKSQSSYQERIIETAKKILKPFILRRTKSDVLKDLPKKVEKLIHCDLTQKQRMHYDALVAKYKSLDGIREDYKSALTIFMQLRKVSNHPLLERHLYDRDLLTKMARVYCDQLENRDSCREKVLEDMEVMSDFELHNLCREKYYLAKYCLQTEAILNSGKFNKLNDLLPDLKEKGCRVLLFSQFTTILDIVVPYLKHKRYKYLRLDGQTPVAERQSLIDEYNNNEDLFIFLLSTRAGGVGINLTAANVVIMHDIDFNPYNDKQAEDRCHRVGQKRDVTVYKLISRDTIEEGILTCANSKLHLEQNVAGNFDGDDSASEDVVKYLMANIS